MKDIFTEPKGFDVHTLRNLGPLAKMAGVWQGTRGLDVKPKADGPRTQEYVERFELQPIDPQTNGPQLFYGLRYHQHVNKPAQSKTYHDQVGYFLWEPATGTIVQTLGIPRGQIAMAAGKAAPDATRFELSAKRGETTFGICSVPFLEEAFTTLSYRIAIAIEGEGWSYEEETLLAIHGREEFRHTDKNTLVKIAEPTPNPLAR